MEVASQKVAVRISGKNAELLGIHRNNECQIAMTAGRLGITPKVLFSDISQGILVTEFIEGTVLSEGHAKTPSMLKKIAHLLKILHEGPVFPGHFSCFATIRDYHSHAQQRGIEFPSHTGIALAQLSQIEQSLGGFSQKPCHNDLLASNFIESRSKLWLLDWEYAAMGDIFFDLGNFSVNQKLSQQERKEFLLAYFGIVRESDWLRLNLMGLVSDMREAFWGFLQSTISSIEFDFRKYGLDHLERFLIESNRAEFKEWLKSPNNSRPGPPSSL